MDKCTYCGHAIGHGQAVSYVSRFSGLPEKMHPNPAECLKAAQQRIGELELTNAQLTGLLGVLTGQQGFELEPMKEWWAEFQQRAGNVATRLVEVDRAMDAQLQALISGRDRMKELESLIGNLIRGQMLMQALIERQQLEARDSQEGAQTDEQS